MKTVKAKNVLDTKLDVKFTGGHSLRMAIASDGLGFSVNKTIIPKGGPHNWHYKHHLEACYCIEGEGIIKDLNTNEAMYVEKDTLYILNNHENMTFEALTDVVLISVFNPPLKGNETHDEHGNYQI
jgi:L-ectoine synthase